MNAHIEAGRFHDTDELLKSALDALYEATVVPTRLPEKDIEELFAPLRGLNPDFSRNRLLALGIQP